jgi:hypothetical protein
VARPRLALVVFFLGATSFCAPSKRGADSEAFALPSDVEEQEDQRAREQADMNAEADLAALKAGRRLPSKALRILQDSPTLTLSSLDPDDDGYRVLGRVKITDPKRRHALVTALTAAIKAADQDGDSLCFEPRHRLEGDSHRQHASMVICFTCEQLKVAGETFAVKGTPRALFDAELDRAGVPRAPASGQ